MCSNFRLAFVEHSSVPLVLYPGAYTYINSALLLSIVSKIHHPQAHRSGFTSIHWHWTLSTLASTLSYRRPENSGVLKKEKIVAKELKDMIQLKQVKSSDTSGASTLTQSSRSGVVWVDSGVEAMSMVMSAGTWGKSSLLRFTTVRPMGAEMFVLEATEKLALPKDRVPLVSLTEDYCLRRHDKPGFKHAKEYCPACTNPPKDILPSLGDDGVNRFANIQVSSCSTIC